MHLVIVGGSGFIGRHFTRHALEQGHRVTVVCRSAPAGLLPAVDVVEGGIEALCAQSQLLASADLVCHLASRTIPATSQADPSLEATGNILPTLSLLQAMQHSGNRRILFLSSGGAVYGRPIRSPMREDHPTEPISPYGVGKLAIEKFLGSFAANHGFRSTIIRPANPYGPDQGKVGQLGAVWTFLQTIRDGGRATLFGDGSVVRDFVHVDDLCRLMMACAEQDPSGIFNCGGGGDGTSLAELIALIERATGQILEVDRQPARAFDPTSIVLDISRAKAELGWSPQISLSEGIAQLVRQDNVV